MFQGERFSRRQLLQAAGLVAVGGIAGAFADRALNQPGYISPYETLISPSEEDIRRLEALVAEGQFTELEPLDPRDILDIEGYIYQPVTEIRRKKMEDLLIGLEDYDFDTMTHRLQHQVTASQLGDRSDYLFMGVNHLVLPSSNGGSFEISTTDVRVFAASSGGSAEFLMLNPHPQSFDLFPGYHVGVKVDAAQDERPNPGMRTVAVVLPK